MMGISSHSFAIGVDIGGTKISAGVVASDGQLQGVTTVPTPPGAANDVVVMILLDLIQRLRLRNPDVGAIGIGAAGAVEWPEGAIRWAPNNDYRDFPLRRIIEQNAALPTIVDNDANAATWAEAQLGRGGPYSNMTFLTVGTGVGAGLVINGQLYRGRSGMAGELGHMIVDPTGERCGCGSRGCLEVKASGSALQRVAHRIAVDEGGALNIEASQPTGKSIHAAACEGDRVAVAAFSEVGYWLGIGIANVVNTLDVEAVVIGGGLAETGELLLEPARRSARDNIFAAAHRSPVSIVAGSFGSRAGIIGAGHLALTEAGYATSSLGPPARTSFAAEDSRPKNAPKESILEQAVE